MEREVHVMGRTDTGRFGKSVWMKELNRGFIVERLPTS